MAKQRLQKVLAAAGIASRRKCEELIEDGLVRVNRKIVCELPCFVEPDDLITINGRRIKKSQKKVYYLLNKPKGVICTNSDPRGRRKAIDIVDSKERVFCVGRLDMDTTGLILLTNDSELANRITHPRYCLTKTYVVLLEGSITHEAMTKLKKGVWLSEGRTNQAGVKLLKRSPKVSSVQITLRQGLNRQVRRMFARVGYNVKSLRRSKIGKLTDRGLGVGKYRTLKKVELELLRKITDK